MPGHIRLGATALTLRDYVLKKPEQRSRTLANPMAAKLGTGAGAYEDMQNWGGWVMDNWEGGEGKKDPSAGGFLHSQADTRFPNRLLLPYMPIQHDPTDNNSYLYQAGLYHPTTEIPVGSTQTIKRISHKFTAQTGSIYILAYLKNENISVFCGVYTDTAGKPDTLVGSGVTLTVADYNNIGYSLYRISLGATTPGTVYHIVMYPTSGTMNIPVYQPGVAGVNNTYNGSTWSAYTTSLTLFAIQTGLSGSITRLVIFNSVLYAASDAILSKLVGGVWTTVHTFGSTITDMIGVGSTLFIALSGAALYTMSTAEAFVVDPAATQATYFALWNGYLWRSLNENVYWSTDGATWSTVIAVGDVGESVVAMKGAGDYLYVATNNTLYYVGFGDQVLTVTPWPRLGSTPQLLTYQGALYVALGRSLMRYEGGNVLPMGPDLGEGLPALRGGAISAMEFSNYWMFVAIAASAPQGASSIWAWNGQGWHHICMLPRTPEATIPSIISDLLYDRSTNTLYMGTSNNYSMMSIYFPDVANYSGELTPRFSPYGWLETDWFFGGLYEIYKDFESVYISGDNLSSSLYAQVYWKDDDSTDWELLGTCTSPRTELRWSNYTTRPASRQIKIGIALYSKTAGATPVIRAIRVKFMTMVMDRYRWSIPIEVSDNQQFPDQAFNNFNAYQMRRHLDSMIKSVPPVIFVDVDGLAYEVKVLSASEQVDKWELIDGQPVVMYTYNMTIEQATTTTLDL
jgi:hypothetical protein